MKIGIDALSLYCPRYYLDLKTMARHRDVPHEKYYEGIGQERMAMPAPDEDIVTMAANAASRVLTGIDLATIDTLMFATESGIDQSKAAAIYVHRLLGLPSSCKAFEVKQACCSSTMALQMAMGQVALNPNRRVLIVASDVARYELGTAGEPTQGAGASAILISANPRLLALDHESGAYTEDVMDFWRPNYLEHALVDGKYSMRIYIKALTEAWQQYRQQSERSYGDFHRFVYHLPFTRMAEKAHASLAKLEHVTLAKEDLDDRLHESLHFSRLIGNCYTAALYISLLSLLENSRDDLAGKRVGLFSYGSGCVGIFFSGVVQPGYQEHLHRVEHYSMLTDRIELSWKQYLDFYNFALPTDGSSRGTRRHSTGRFRLAGIEDHQRQYEIVDAMPATQIINRTTNPIVEKDLSVIGT